MIRAKKGHLNLYLYQEGKNHFVWKAMHTDMLMFYAWETQKEAINELIKRGFSVTGQKHPPVQEVNLPFSYDQQLEEAKRCTNLKELRKISGFSREEFCSRVGISLDTYKSYTSGRRLVPEKVINTANFITHLS